MHSSLINLIVFIIISFVGLNIVSYYSEKVKVLPQVIWILLLGLGYGAIAHYSNIPLPELVLDPNLILFVFVPILIFGASYKMCLYHFRRVLVQSISLATLGIIISSLIVAVLFHFILSMPFLVALLFGVIISATDPIAVSAILHSTNKIGITKKMLIEGESILNDGFVVAMFGLLSVLIFGIEKINIFFTGGGLVLKIVGSLFVGLVLGRIARYILKRWRSSLHELTVNITLALAFASFLLAEILHFPGVLAVFAAALSYGYRPEKESKHIFNSQIYVWEYLEYIVNSILFFLLGASFFAQADLMLISIGIFTLSIFTLFISRVMALGIMLPFMKIQKKKTTKKDFWMLNFAGSRGAISVALILLLPHDFVYKSQFLTLAFIMVFFSLIVYPILMKQSLESE